MNVKKINFTRPLGIVILVLTVLACFVDSARFSQTIFVPIQVGRYPMVLSLGAVLAEIGFCAILVSTLRMRPEMRIVATFVAALIVAGPLAIGVMLWQQKYVTPGVGPLSHSDSRMLIPLFALPLLIAATGCALHALRIRRGMLLTLEADAKLGTTTAKENVLEYASLIATVGLGALLIYLTWLRMNFRSDSLALFAIAVPVCLLGGGVLLLPLTIMIFKLPWRWLILFLFAATLALGSRYEISFLAYSNWRPSLGKGEWSFLEIAKAAFPIYVALSFVSLFLVAFRLIGFGMTFQDPQTRRIRPKPVAVHPLDRRDD